jgi:HK97 family phage prohead protease
MKTKYIFATVKQINEDDRSIEAVASTAQKDRDEEIILTSAFEKNLSSFKANPVILATHQHRLSSGSSPVIGSADPDSIKITDQDVSFKMRFANTPLGNEYWQLYKDKHMRAFSIGFIPIKSEQDDTQRNRWGGPLRIHTEIELLEISAVPVPSNPQALARAKGYFGDDDDIKEIITEAFTKEVNDLKSQLTNLENSLDELKSMIADSKGFAEKLLLDNYSDPAACEGEKIIEHCNRIKKSLKTVS